MSNDPWAPPYSFAATSSLGCTIPSDPDIAGTGVWAVIYMQNLISFVPALWALWIERSSAMSWRSDSQTLNVHANIVLSLSWMNNTNTFIYFLLYIQHKSQPGPGQIGMDWH
ncbi:hypothetical protein C8J57DRAFT_1658934 [Mycena rebaudengoi]|nr:hypothetical protein C8J57DRAFT_1658934 [Mycena rebaudengoi]